MQTRFSPSINIIRDCEQEFAYIPTANTERVFSQIINDYKTGIRSFNIIGSYGTGKSAFLLVLERSLNGQGAYSQLLNGQFGDIQTFEYLNIVGEYRSMLDSFAQTLALPTDAMTQPAIFAALDRKYAGLREQKRGLVIVIDELGKFLEYAAQNTPEKELYFIQQLAEYANDASKHILFLTTLHQGFEAYGRNLEVSQRQEWEKVKGRLKEITFNEPVEILLHLAAEHLHSTRTHTPPETVATLVEIINQSRTFPHRTALTVELARKLSPFDPLTAAVLTLALQHYGQNERSLFTFLNANDRFGLHEFDPAAAPYYNLAILYDYLLYNNYAFLSTKYNPHYTQWGAIKKAIERTEGSLAAQHVDPAVQLVKVIGLLNIFGAENAKIHREFLLPYTAFALGAAQPEEALNALETFKIIRYIEFKQKFILFEGTDLDIELAILHAATHVSAVQDVVKPLEEHFDFPYFLAKAVTYQKGTPRFFEFKLSETPIGTPPTGETDGIINLVFAEHLDRQRVQTLSGQIGQAILYGVYQQTKQIRQILFELEKIKHVSGKNRDDRVAAQELDNLRQHYIEELNRHVLHALYAGSGEVEWFFNGQKVHFEELSKFNAFLSKICEQIYPDTPEFRNELVNRHKLSGAISMARRNFLQALLERWMQADLGFPSDKFPPEKTIYLTLLKETGIHRQSADGYTLGAPDAPSFQKLWQQCEAFLESAKPARRGLPELLKLLSEKPFKLKQGLIEFWLPVFLFIKREDFALYYEQRYTPELNVETFDLMSKQPEKFQIKTFDVQGVKLDLFNKYRAFVKQQEGESFSTTSFIETVKPFLIFYQRLPEYTKKTGRLETSALRLRDVIANAQDPEETFFEDFPRALGYTRFNPKAADDAHLQDYVRQLQTSLKELQTCFDALINRIEAYLLSECGYVGLVFPQYREELVKRYRSLKKHLLLDHQKVFYNRLLSKLDDRQAWIASIVQAVLHKNIEQVQDEEEELVFDRLSSAIRELDNLCELSDMEVDPEQEEVFKVEVTSYTAGSQKEIVRLPKNKAGAELSLEAKIREILAETKDARIRVAVLTRLLQEESRHE